MGLAQCKWCTGSVCFVPANSYQHGETGNEYIGFSTEYFKKTAYENLYTISLIDIVIGLCT